MPQNYVQYRLIEKQILHNFEITYQENYQKMYCIAIKMVHDDDVVPDIIQDVFIYYYERLKSGQSVLYPKSWLFRATINKCIDFLNHRKKHAGIDSLNSKAVEEDLINTRQDKIIIKQVLSKLNQKEKTLAVLYSEGFSYKEISEIAGIKYSTIGKALSRTLMKMGVELKKLGYEMH